MLPCSTQDCYSRIDITGCTSGCCTTDCGKKLYNGGCVLGSTVYFAPENVQPANVGVVAAESGGGNWSTVELNISLTPGLTAPGENMYQGCIATETSSGGKVYFVMRKEKNVGVLETATRTFYTIDTRDTLDGGISKKFIGATQVGDKVSAHADSYLPTLLYPCHDPCPCP
jgi:hypothetical protein